jgi:hypothetical protein
LPFAAAAKHLGWNTKIMFEKERDKKPPKDREYIDSLEIEKHARA